MQLSNSATLLLSSIEGYPRNPDHFESFKDILIHSLGGDAGNDIGDSFSALEMLSNIATQDHDKVEYSQAISNLITNPEITRETIYDFLIQLSTLTDDELNQKHLYLYGIPAWSRL